MIEEFQRKTIYEMIISSGWKITEVEKAELNWWAAEMWLIESIWSPVGKTAFVTFLYEQESLQEVWEIRASHDRPVERYSDSTSCYLHLKSRWQAELPQFINCLSDLRNK